jgi:hypothetical protein
VPKSTPPPKADRESRIRELRDRERIVEDLLRTIRAEIRRTEAGEASLVEGDDYWLRWARPGLDLGATLIGEHDDDRAAKHVAAAIELLSDGCWQYGLAAVLEIATLELRPGVTPAARRNEVIAAAAAAGVPRAELAHLVDPDLDRDPVRRERALGTVRQAIARGRKRQR